MKTIFVTGATCELGREICRQLLDRPCNLILTARSNERLQSLRADLHKKNITVIPSDFTDINTFSSAIECVSSVANEGIDGVVLIPPQPDATTEIFPSAEKWNELFMKSFIGPSVLLGKLLPFLQKSDSSVVLISGISSKQPFSNYTTSNTIRTAWLGFAKTVADNIGPKNIRFNTLSCGGIMTEKFERKLAEEANKNHLSVSEILKNRVDNIPLRRYAEKSEIADTVCFLLLSLASRHITGQNIAFDGGFSRSY